MVTKKIFNLFLYLGRYFSLIKENYYLDKKINFVSKKITKKLWLEKLYRKRH